MMSLGFVSAILPELTLEEVLAFASKEGFSSVELMCWPLGKAERRYAGVTHVDAAALEKAAVLKIKDLMAKTGVGISSLGYYPNYLVPDPQEAEVYIGHLKRLIKASADLGVGLVTTFIGRDWKKSVDENWPRFKEVWKPLVKIAEDHGIRIGIENCPMLFSSDEWPGGKNLAATPSIWRRMFEEIPSASFGLNYDPSHLVWQQMDCVQPLFEFKDRIFHVHAKDVRVDRHRLNDVGIMAPPLHYHCPKLPGLGEVDWGRFFSVLGDIKYAGPVAIEVEDRAYEQSLETRKQALRQSARFLWNYIPR
jgi:sugar phosphate isomerase/epimerase